ncbi:hypothetical protein BH18ACT6_BH18ACT6_22810 [soil metagenome]
MIRPHKHEHDTPWDKLGESVSRGDKFGPGLRWQGQVRVKRHFPGGRNSVPDDVETFEAAVAAVGDDLTWLDRQFFLENGEQMQSAIAIHAGKPGRDGQVSGCCGRLT